MVRLKQRTHTNNRGRRAITLFLVLLVLAPLTAHSVEFDCIGSYGEATASYATHGHTVFLNQGYTLRVFDNAAARPREIARLRFDSLISSMALQ